MAILERQVPCNNRSYTLESAVSVALSVTALSGDSAALSRESPCFLRIPKKRCAFSRKSNFLKSAEHTYLNHVHHDVNMCYSSKGWHHSNFYHCHQSHSSSHYQQMEEQLIHYYKDNLTGDAHALDSIH